MEVRTLEALKKSIAHWKRMSKFKKSASFDKESPSSEDCALCTIFARWPTKTSIYSLSHLCDGCPVYVKTGYRDCGNTPYQAAVRYQTAYKYRPLDYGVPDFDAEKWKKLCNDEIKFLKSLLPKGAKSNGS